MSFTELFTTKYKLFSQQIESLLATTKKIPLKGQDEDSLYQLIISLADKIIDYLGDLFPLELKFQPQFVVTGVASNKTVTLWQAIPTSMPIPENLFFQQSAATINEDPCAARYFYRLAKFAGTEQILAPILALILKTQYSIDVSCQTIQQYSLSSTPLVRLIYSKNKYKEIQLTKYLHNENGNQETLGLCIQLQGKKLVLDLHKCLACEGNPITLYNSVSRIMKNVDILPPLKSKSKQVRFLTSSSYHVLDKQQPMFGLYVLSMTLEKEKQTLLLNALKNLFTSL